MELPAGFALHEWQPSEVERFWDFVSRTQPDAYFSHRVGSNIAWHYRRLLSAHANVVDYGCGTGRFLEAVLAYPCAAAGYDTSPKSREVTDDRLLEYSGFAGTFGAEQLGGKTGEFDVAFCLEVVEHLYDHELDQALSDLRSLLRIGGSLVLTTPDDEDLSKSWICNPVTGTVFHRWQHVRSWTQQTLSDRLQQAGFDVVKIESLHPEALGRTPRALAMRCGYATVRRNSDRTLMVTATRVHS